MGMIRRVKQAAIREDKRLLSALARTQSVGRGVWPA